MTTHEAVDSRPAFHELRVGVDAPVRVGVFSIEHPPVATLRSGDRLRILDIPSPFGGGLDAAATIDDILALRAGNAPWGPHSLVGPVAIDGASAGDVLEVRILAVEPGATGANYALPEDLALGALPGYAPQGLLRRYELSPGDKRLAVADGVTARLAPFPGIVGVMPADHAALTSVAPGPFGGNLDLAALTAGSRLFLPVQRDRALLYLGDFHAAQGDGEVNLTAIEAAAARCDIEVAVHTSTLAMPLAETAQEWIAVGLGSTLDLAFDSALSNMLGFLNGPLGLPHDDAYVVASTVVDFRLTQVVNGTKGVHAALAKAALSPARRERLESVYGRLDTT